jgi:hypothetical protein
MKMKFSLARFFGFFILAGSHTCFLVSCNRLDQIFDRSFSGKFTNFEKAYHALYQ